MHASCPFSASSKSCCAHVRTHASDPTSALSSNTAVERARTKARANGGSESARERETACICRQRTRVGRGDPHGIARCILQSFSSRSSPVALLQSLFSSRPQVALLVSLFSRRSHVALLFHLCSLCSLLPCALRALSLSRRRGRTWPQPRRPQRGMVSNVLEGLPPPARSRSSGVLRALAA